MYSSRVCNTKIVFAVGEVECQLKDNIFTSGSDRIPLVGFAKDPSVIFLKFIYNWICCQQLQPVTFS